MSNVQKLDIFAGTKTKVGTLPFPAGSTTEFVSCIKPLH